MIENSEIGALITQELGKHGPCTLDALAYKLPTCSWNQVFMAVDTLSRDGAITLQPQARFQYLISLAPSHKQVLHVDAIRNVPGALQRVRTSYGR
jgi:hypothetical protein